MIKEITYSYGGLKYLRRDISSFVIRYQPVNTSAIIRRQMNAGRIHEFKK